MGEKGNPLDELDGFASSFGENGACSSCSVEDELPGENGVLIRHGNRAMSEHVAVTLPPGWGNALERVSCMVLQN